MKMFRRMAMVGLMVAAGSTASLGQVVLVSAKSADGLIAGARSVVAATDLGEPIRPVLGFLDNLKSPAMLKGIDRTKPLGVYGDIKEGQAPFAVLLVPVANQADFLATLEGVGIASKPMEGVNGVTHAIDLPGPQPVSLLGRFEDGYACFTNHPGGPPTAANLKPAKLLAARPAWLAATIRFDLIPASIKKTFLDGLETNIAPQREQRPGEDEPTYQGRLAGMALSQNMMKGLIQDGGPLNLELAESQGSLAIELTARALPRSKLAATFQSFGSSPSLFRGIGSKSIAEAYVQTPISETIKKPFALITNMMREGLANKNVDDLANEIGNDMVELYDSVLTAPSLDIGAALLGPFPGPDNSSTYTGVLGLKVKDGSQFERFFRKMADAAAKDMPPAIEKIAMDRAKADNGTVSIHEVRFKPGNAAFDRFGEPVIRLATRRDAVVMTVGGQGLPAIQRALEAIARPPTGAAPQAKVEVAVGKVALAAPETPKASADLAGMFQAQGIFQGPAADRDRVGLSINGGDSLTVRFKLDAPVIKFLALMGVTR